MARADEGSVAGPAVRQVALLRGINVGRGNRVPMADLRAALTGLGFTGVRTHLNSGNALFDGPPDVAANAAAIGDAVAASTGVRAAVVGRTAQELAAAVAADPLGAADRDGSRYLLGFLSAEPAPDRVAQLRERAAGRGEADDLAVVGRHVYLWCPDGVLASMFAGFDWDRMLGVTTTMRNRRTAGKLVELAGG